jgi:D-lactate dehydrogenase
LAFQVVYPDNVTQQCCGMLFNSRGFTEAADTASSRLEEALMAASEGGKHPIVCDTSPCLATLKEKMPAALKFAMFEPVEFISKHMLDKLEFTKVRMRRLPSGEPSSCMRDHTREEGREGGETRVIGTSAVQADLAHWKFDSEGSATHCMRPWQVKDSVAVHVPCSSKKMGIEAAFLNVASKCAHEVHPSGIPCCGMAGDRGMRYVHPPPHPPPSLHLQLCIPSLDAACVYECGGPTHDERRRASKSHE